MQAPGKEATVAVRTPIRVEATRVEVRATVTADEVAGAPTALVVAEVEGVMIGVAEEGVEVDGAGFQTKPRAPMELPTLSLPPTGQLRPVANPEGLAAALVRIVVWRMYY